MNRKKNEKNPFTPLAVQPQRSMQVSVRADRNLNKMRQLLKTLEEHFMCC